MTSDKPGEYGSNEGNPTAYVRDKIVFGENAGNHLSCHLLGENLKNARRHRRREKEYGSYPEDNREKIEKSQSNLHIHLAPLEDHSINSKRKIREKRAN